MLVSSGSALPTTTDLADSAPMNRNATYLASTGIGLVEQFATYGALYKAQPWVYTLVRKTAFAASRLPLKVYRRESDTDRTEARSTPYGDLIRRPNPRLGAKLLWLWAFSTVELHGESMLLKLRDANKQVRELQPIHPSHLIVEERDGEIWYVYMGAGRLPLAAWPASEIVHFRGYNPDNAKRGLSPCEPLRQTLLAEDAMRRANTSSWRNGARPSFALSTEQALSDAAFARLEASWNAKHSGVDNWSKTAIFEEGLKPVPLQLSANDMQYIAGRQLNREECCAVWDVPPPAVQILDRATFSNITEQMRSLYRETMAPRLEAYEDALATQLALDFDPSGDLYAEFSLDAVLRGSFEARIAAKAQAIGTGQMTPAESRAEENWSFIEGSDQLLVNAALIPLKVVEETSIPTGDDVVPHPQPVKGISGRDAAKIDRRLAKATVLDDIDADALVLNVESGEEVLGLVRAAYARGASVSTLRAWVAASADPIDLTSGEDA